MDEIKFDNRNYRKHNDKNKRLIRKSLSELGAGRSVLLDADNSLIAGNGVYEQAKALGIPVRVIETAGDELIAVKRTDIREDDEKRTRLALADNATSDTSEWDIEAIKADLPPVIIEEWEINLPGVEESAEEKKQRETERLSKLEYTGTYYEPKEKPEIKLQDCFSLDKFNAKIDALNEYNLTDEQKNVLRVFCYRFIKIDFESVANYYAFNATDEERKAIERLRLVLVDNGLDGFIEDDMLRVTQAMIGEAEDEPIF